MHASSGSTYLLQCKLNNVDNTPITYLLVDFDSELHETSAHMLVTRVCTFHDAIEIWHQFERIQEI